MSGIEWLVVVSGIGAIAWVNWYFLFSEPGHARDRGVADRAEGDQ